MALLCSGLICRRIGKRLRSVRDSCRTVDKKVILESCLVPVPAATLLRNNHEVTMEREDNFTK